MSGWAEAEEKIHFVKGHCLLHVDWMGSSKLLTSQMGKQLTGRIIT